MRTLIALVITLGIIVGISFWTENLLEQSAGFMVKRIDKISAEIRNNNWLEATKHTGELEKTWQEQKGWWPMILDHQEIDNIDFAMAQVKEYIANHDKPLALGQLSELKLMIEHIPRKEAVNLENIM